LKSLNPGPNRVSAIRPSFASDSGGDCQPNAICRDIDAPPERFDLRSIGFTIGEARRRNTPRK
jgi:hypothetical protein